MSESETARNYEGNGEVCLGGSGFSFFGRSGKLPPMKVRSPVEMTVPPGGVCFAESMHAEGFRMAERDDPFHKLIYVLEGAVEYERSGGKKKFSAGKGTVLIIPAGVRHRIRDEHPATLLVLGLARSFVDSNQESWRLWEKLSSATVIVIGSAERRRLELFWRRALIENRHGKPGAGCIRSALALETLVVLVRAEPPRSLPGAARERVEAVVREVEESFPEPWSLDAAAARAGLSRRRFSGLHRELFGESFLEKLTTLRLSHSAWLLKKGEATVTGAMFASGFNDLSHFYRVFRARYGRPPASWKEDGTGLESGRGHRGVPPATTP